MPRIVVYLVTLSLIGSCNFFNSKNKDEQPIARVYDKYLYRSDLAGVGKGAARPEDSIQAVRNYIDTWVRHNLMLRYAEDNVQQDAQRLNERLQDYKESLLIYQYENDLVNQKLDTVVTDAEVQAYYYDHKDIFSLKSSVTRLKYVMLPSDKKIDMDSASRWLKYDDDYNQPKLEGFCKQYATSYSLGDTAWYNNDEVAALLPVSRFNLDNAQFNKSYVEVKDSAYTYLIKFEDYRIKGSDAPIDFVKQEIRNILVNQRKTSFVNALHKSIYDDGLKNGDFEVYVDQNRQ